ncbi:hypothetical protein DVH05_026314 [Phytophthora capsici]|nr:hypothetical protein DVH05_026314 [Phytophthora capsici]
MKRRQNKEVPLRPQFVKQRKEMTKGKKSYHNRYDYLKRVGRRNEYQDPLPPFVEPTPEARPSLRAVQTIVGSVIVHR